MLVNKPLSALLEMNFLIYMQIQIMDHAHTIIDHL